jgi:hypothetical protein
MHVNKAISQALLITPPRAFDPQAGPFGQEVVFNVTNVAAVLDLQKLAFNVYYDAFNAQNNAGLGAPVKGPRGAVGSFLTIRTDAADLGFILGATLASVTGANVPNLAAVGTLNSDGTYLGTQGVCHRLAPAGSAGFHHRYRLQIGVDNFLGLVSSVALDVVRLYVSSEAGLQA